ncbi:MAG: Fic family protein [Alphaproteobacteria bacterium]|nr:Fic family protein [Alphaproteobacteria bacterium]
MLGAETIKITPPLLNRISNIDQFKGLWAGLERYTTGLNLIGDVAAYGQAFHAMLGPLQDRPIDLEVLCLLHAGLQRGERSGFRTGAHPLEIMKDGALIGALETAEPEQIAPLLEKLLAWTQRALAEEALHPLIVIAVFVAVFLQVCPFTDHNQRLARLLVTLLMLKAGYVYAPYVPLDPLVNEAAEALCTALRHNQESLEAGRPDWSEWLGFFLTLLQRQKDVLASRLEVRSGDLAQMPALSAKILALFEKQARLQMKEIMKLTGGRRATIKLRLGELVEAGLLRRHGQARATWYSLV